MDSAQSIIASPLINKKLFTISDSGEFDDGIYREQASNGLFGRFIGRATASLHEKATFTSADITLQGYLYKRGSWFKSWKKRYFILRKDIHALSYFPSAESMTLLGSIKLERGSSIEYVQPQDVEGMSNVMAIRQSPDESLDKAVLIRAEDTEDMVKWTQRILTEIFRHRSKEIDEEDRTATDRWHALFDSAPLVESTNKARRGAATGASRFKDGPSSAPRDNPPPLPRAARSAKQIETMSNIASSLAAAENSSNADDGEENARVKAGMSTLSAAGQIDDVNGIPVSMLCEGLSNIDLVGMDLPPVDSDDDDDVDDVKPAPPSLRHHRSDSDGATSGRNISGEGKDDVSEPGTRSASQGGALINQAPHRRTPRKIRKQKREKKEKPEKKPGPPPFTHTIADRFVSPSSDKMVGFQLSLQLENSCGFQDKISIYIYTSSSSAAVPEEAGRPAMDASDIYLASTVGQAGSSAQTASAVLKSSLDWTLRAQTEPLIVSDRPEYGRTTIDRVNLHFSLMQCPFPDDVDLILVQVFKLDAGNPEEVKVKEGAKIKPGDVSSNMSKVSSCMFNKKAMDDRHIFKLHMKVVQSPTVDISNPIEVKPRATLGVIRLSSSAVFAQRRWLASTFKMKPYSEVTYSFATSTGQTYSLEQLYASPYSTLVAENLSALWLSERSPMVNSLLSILEDEESQMKYEQKRLESTPDSEEALATITANHDVVLDSLDVLDAIGSDIIGPLEEIADFNSAVADGADNVDNKVISAEMGGCFLRRSIWKKDEKWQFATVNLNVHLMISQHFHFADLASSHGTKRKKSSKDPLHIVPTITLGCPAAHILKYHDGGLRRILAPLASDLHKLIWMQAIQSQYFTEMLSGLFERYPRDAVSMFGISSSLFNNHTQVATVTKKRLELANRLDMCGSQVLGFAVTSIRTVLMLATRNGGQYMDVLARSLKVGFLLCLQSLLSTQGDEMGMIEDLDIACLWLHLVSIRLVTYPAAVKADDGWFQSAAVEAALMPEIKPRRLDLQDLIIRRDANGRIIVDVAITEDEAASIRAAYKSLEGFEYQGYNPFSLAGETCVDPNFHVPVLFSPTPVVKMTDTTPVVHAVVEMCAVSFSQGVNEMQTLANMSSAKEIFRQTEMNVGSLARVKEYQARYLRVYQFQISLKAETLSAENMAEQQALNRSVRALTRMSTIAIQSVNDSGFIVESHMEALNRLFEDGTLAVNNAAQSPSDKHVHVLLKTSAMCREMGGTVGILCKSGKDRTSMGATLETARALVEQLGAENGMEICQIMRMHGCRRMNVFANTGQPMYAFNTLQRLSLPVCYRPPVNACSGSVNS